MTHGQVIQRESLLRCGLTFLARLNELISSHDATKQPVELSSSFDSADHPDIRTINLRHNAADEIFRQAEGVGQFYLNIEHSHFQPRFDALTPHTRRSRGAVASGFYTQSYVVFATARTGSTTA